MQTRRRSPSGGGGLALGLMVGLLLAAVPAPAVAQPAEEVVAQAAKDVWCSVAVAHRKSAVLDAAKGDKESVRLRHTRADEIVSVWGCASGFKLLDLTKMGDLPDTTGAELVLPGLLQVPDDDVPSLDHGIQTRPSFAPETGPNFELADIYVDLTQDELQAVIDRVEAEARGYWTPAWEQLSQSELPCWFASPDRLDIDLIDRYDVVVTKPREATTGLGGPWFNFKVAWWDDEAENGGWIYDGQDRWVDARVEDGDDVVFQGGSAAVCRFARSRCVSFNPILLCDE